MMALSCNEFTKHYCKKWFAANTMEPGGPPKIITIYLHTNTEGTTLAHKLTLPSKRHWNYASYKHIQQWINTFSHVTSSGHNKWCQFLQSTACTQKPFMCLKVPNIDTMVVNGKCRVFGRDFSFIVWLAAGYVFNFLDVHSTFHREFISLTNPTAEN